MEALYGPGWDCRPDVIMALSATAYTRLMQRQIETGEAYRAESRENWSAINNEMEAGYLTPSRRR